MQPSPKLGILGGMGPIATADFLRKLIDRTPATRDEEHVPVVLHSVPQLPDRIQAIFEGGRSPLPALIDAVDVLRRAGAACIVMPCNTAHYWYDELAAGAGVPFLHIADAALAAITNGGRRSARLGIAGTRGTLAAGFYQRRLAACGRACIVNGPAEQKDLVDPAIEAIKANDLARATPMVERAVECLLSNGADAVMLACTELPLVLPRLTGPLAARCVDVTAALADACIAWWRSTYQLAPQFRPSSSQEC